jgi:flagellar FliL protein
MKTFMPAIRNGILMILAHKTSRELLDRAGKEQLAAEILRESARTMGIDVDEPEAEVEKVADVKATDAAHDKAGDDDEAKPKAAPKPKPKKEAAAPNPIRRVHFANFIIQ